jgi:hypothetical protein
VGENRQPDRQEDLQGGKGKDPPPDLVPGLVFRGIDGPPEGEGGAVRFDLSQEPVEQDGGDLFFGQVKGGWGGSSGPGRVCRRDGAAGRQLRQPGTEPGKQGRLRWLE